MRCPCLEPTPGLHWEADGWERRCDIRKAFTRRSVLDGLESRKLPIVVMNMATVDDPGMIVCIARIVSCCHWLQEGFPASSIYHIGVGSRVARSTAMGNARASVRGTSNSRSPTLLHSNQ